MPPPSLPPLSGPLGGGHGRSLEGVRSLAREQSLERGWALQARGRIEGPPVAASDGLLWLARECYERTIDEFDAVLAFTGEEGISKSMLALEFALEVGKLTGRPFSFDQLCYSGDDVLACYERAQRSSVIWYDEGARGLLAGETFSPEQMKLVKALMLVRETGAILVVCIPDIFSLAKKVRGRRATFWVHIEKRGTRRKPAPSQAKVFERDRRLRFLPTQALGFARSLRCPRLTFDPLPPDHPLLLEYLATKHRKLGEFFDEQRPKDERRGVDDRPQRWV